MIPDKVRGLFCVGLLNQRTNFIQISQVHELTHVICWNLERKLTFLLFGLLLIAVHCNPCYKTIFGSKLLGNNLIRDPKCLRCYLWKVLEIKNEEEGRKTRWGILERYAYKAPPDRVCP